MADPDPELKAVWRRLEEHPDDVDTLSKGAELSLRGLELGQARRFIERALLLDPENPRALVQYSALLLGEGQPLAALDHLEEVLRAHPEALDAWSLRGMIGMQLHNPSLARESFEEYLKRAPEGPAKDRVRGLLEQLATE